MKINVLQDAEELGRRAAEHAAEILRSTVQHKGYARLTLSTGNSQLETLRYLVGQDVPWDKVEMFHLDEYVGLSDRHGASFRRYLREKFINQVSLKAAYLVNPEEGIRSNIEFLTNEIRKAPIDVALIGIGENAHIAFNDPPANFDTSESYIVVDLDERCKRQQVGEGWFANVDEVPKQAVTMTVHQILESEVIISCVPHKVKAEAVKKSIELGITNVVPASILQSHSKVFLYLDTESASLLNEI